MIKPGAFGAIIVDMMTPTKPPEANGTPLASVAATPDSDVDRLIDTDDILDKILPVSRVTFWNMRRRGDFPAGIRIAPNRIAWRLSDVRAWIASRPRA